jgi:uncharacterized protein
METMLEAQEYLAARERPLGRPAMLQRWHDLLFLHFSVEPGTVQQMLPSGLTIDTYEGRAWIGLVLFRMSGIRHPLGPALPWLSAFPETNVRTYVHRNGQMPGVFFFSLDAARWLACRAARAMYCLPYYHAFMKCHRRGSQVIYTSERREGRFAARAHVEATIGQRLSEASSGSLEHFLVERYVLYSQRGSILHYGKVHHEPYPLAQAALTHDSQSLVEACGIDCAPWEHVCFSDGVRVEVFPLYPVID